MPQLKREFSTQPAIRFSQHAVMALAVIASIFALGFAAFMGLFGWLPVAFGHLGASAWFGAVIGLVVLGLLLPKACWVVITSRPQLSPFLAVAAWTAMALLALRHLVR